MRISLSKDTSKPNEIFVNVEISEFDHPPEFKHSHSFKYIPSATDNKGNLYGEIIVYEPVNSGEELVDSREGSHISYIFNLEKCFNKKCKEEKDEDPEYVCSTISGKNNRLLVADVFHTTPKFNHLQEFGDALFKALFSHHALTVLKKTGPDLPNGGIYLHLNKHLVLDDIPWEYAKEGDTFLVQQRKFTRMYKKMEDLPKPSKQKPRLPQRRFSMLTRPPLRIVVVAPDPIIPNGATDLADLHLNDQWQVFVNEHSSNSKKIILENVYPPTLDKMDTLLKANSEVAPVLHFMGHCVAKGDKRRLVFEDSKTGELEYVDPLLRTISENLPLAFLSACNAREVARGLLERGILYTIGSYCPIPDDLARKFESKFYQFLANGMTIEMAMWKARVFFSEKSDKKDDQENYYFPGAMILYSSTFREADGTFKCEEGMPIIKDHMPSNNLTLIPSASPFYGRKSELLSLLSRLREMATRNEEACQMCTIVGIGGQGKTALAMEAVRRAAHLFTGGIFAWQFGSTAISFTEYLRHLVNVIFPKYWGDEDNGKGVLALNIRQKFVNHPSCLLILDHADTLNSAYRQNDKDAIELVSWLIKLTSNSAVKILATSHESLGWMKEHDFPLRGFTNDIDSGCVLFVQQLTTEAMRQSQLSKRLLRELVTCMSGHPLSLVLLGRAASQQQYLDKFLIEIFLGHFYTMLADEDVKEKFKEHFEPMVNSLTPKNMMLLCMCSLFIGPITAKVLAFFSYFIDCDKEPTKDIEQILNQLHSCEFLIKKDGEYRIHVGLRKDLGQHNTLLKSSLNLPTRTVRDEVCIFGIVKSSDHNNTSITKYYAIRNVGLEKINVPDMANRSIIKNAVQQQPPYRLNVFILFEVSEISNGFPRSCANWISKVDEGRLPFILCSDKTAFSLMKEVAEILRDSLKETHWIIMTEAPSDNLLASHQNGDVKEVFYDVPAPNDAFTGRSQILEDIATKLNKSFDPDGRRILALTGLEGMGKTQIMLRYCYLHREEYDFVFWLEMNGWSTVTDSFRRLAINLGLDEKSTKGKSFETFIGWVRTWLEKRKKWLLLLASADNVEINKKVFDLLPRFGGDIILTTHKAIPMDKAIVIIVQKMEKNEALQLLLGENLTEKSDKTIQDAQEIVNELGYMPLAISLARAYVENQGCTLGDYLEKLRERKGLLDYSLDQDKFTVGTVCLVSFNYIQAKNPTAIQILKYCAFLHSDSIPARLFEKIYSDPKNTLTSSTSPVNEFDIELSIEAAKAAIEVLKQYSFLTQTRKELEGGNDNPQNNILSIQRLVQTVIYDTISAERKPELVSKIVTALNQETKFSRSGSVAQTFKIQRIINAYLPHVRHLATLPIQKEAISKEFNELLAGGVHYLLTNRMYSGLEDLARKSIQLSKTINGPEHESTATALYNLAVLYEDQGRCDAAQELQEVVSQILEKVREMHPGTLIVLNDPTSIYKNQGDFEKEIYFTSSNQPNENEQNLLEALQTGDVKEAFYDVPAPNDAFTGRSQILEDMATKLDKSSNPNGRRILALTGLGGMGKTQIMLRYCYLHREEYDFIFWLEMDGWSTATDSFRRLVINLGLDEKSTKGKDFETLISWVRTWLENKKKKWLLLLASSDDDEISKKMFDLLPRFGGDVILTARRANLRGKAIVIPVQKMEQSEAIQLLLGEDLTETIQDAQEIVDKLGCMPLAISLARAYIENQGCTLKDYLGNFRKKSESLLDYRSDQDKYTVRTVWLVSLDRIQAKNPRAIQILEDCAFLHPDGIPAHLFEKIYSDPKNTSTSTDELDTERSISPAETVQAAIQVLKQFSFLTQPNPQNNVLSIQRLVQTVIYDTISAQRKLVLVGKIVTALNQETKFSLSAAQTLEVQRIMNAYLPHIRQLATSPIQKEVTSKEFDKVLTRGIHYLLTNRMYSGLEELAQSSIEISKTIYGSEHGNTATALNNLALLYEGQGNYDAAQKLLEEVLQIREKILGSKHAGTVMAMNNLASVYKNQGAFEKAEIYFTKALNIRKRSEKEKGKEKEREKDIATSLNNLAGLYKSQGKYGEAESLYRVASEIFEKEFGPEHLETATPLNNLAVTYYRQGKYEKSVGPQLKALAIRRKVLGPNHADTARTMNNLAGLYRSQGKYKEAKPLHQKALTICQTILGPEDPDTATCLNNLAKLHELQGNYTEARPLYEKALEIREKVLGPTNVITAESLHNLAAFHKIMGKYKEAEELHTKASEIRERILGSEHLEAAESRNSLAAIYEIQGEFEKAKEWYQLAWDIRENILGEEHPDTAESLNNQARLYNILGMYTEAEPLYTRAREIRKKMLGLNHPDTATSLNDQALLYINQSKVHNDQAKLQKAELLTEQALTIRETALGSEHPDIASSLDNLALIYERQGRLDEAERQYERALAILKKAFGPEHPKFVGTSEKLLFVQEKLRSVQDMREGLQLPSLKITGILAVCNLVPALVQIFGVSRKTIRY